MQILRLPLSIWDSIFKPCWKYPDFPFPPCLIDLSKGMFETVVSWNQTSYVPTFSSSWSPQPKLHCCVSLSLFCWGSLVSHCQRLISHSMKHCKQPQHFPISHPAAISSGIVIVISVALLPSNPNVCTFCTRSFILYVLLISMSNEIAKYPQYHCANTLWMHIPLVCLLPTFELLSSQESARWYLSSKFQCPQCCNLSFISPSKAPLFFQQHAMANIPVAQKKYLPLQPLSHSQSKIHSAKSKTWCALEVTFVLSSVSQSNVIPSLHLINSDLFYFVILIIFLACSCQFFLPRLSILRFDFSSSTLTEEIPEFTQRSFHILHTLYCCQSLDFSFVFWKWRAAFTSSAVLPLIDFRLQVLLCVLPAALSPLAFPNWLILPLPGWSP